MAQGAKIESVDVVMMFRAALIKFAEVGNVALTGAEADITRMEGWLERDQAMYWTNQLRKRHEDVMKCEEAVRQKRLFKGADGRVQSAVDEMKALGIAKRKKEEAEVKINNVKKSIQVLRKEGQLYKGRTQKLATSLQSDIPKAVHMIDNMLADIAAYLAIQTQGKGFVAAGSGESVAMAPSTKVGHEKLRDLTPTPEQRADAKLRIIPPDDVFFQPWTAGLMEDWQHEALAKLSIEGRLPIDPEQRIVVGKDCWLQPKIYLDRREPAFEGDSGWFLGSAAESVTGEKTEYDAIRVGDFVAARSDLAKLLELPTGFLVVLDSGGPAAMLDAGALDVWSVAMMMSNPPEEAPAEGAAPEAAAQPAAQ